MGSNATRPSAAPEPSPPVDYRQIALKKVADREALLSLYQAWRIPDPGSDVKDVMELLLSRITKKEREIVTQDATELTSKIAAREYTSTEVLTSFCKVAVVSQDLTNSLTEIFFEEGFARAKELDEHLERTGQVVGPLHGLPVSIKDHILVKGQDTASGYCSWAYHSYADRDAAVVKILRQAGAIIYVKTANPQTLLVCANLLHLFPASYQTILG